MRCLLRLPWANVYFKANPDFKFRFVLRLGSDDGPKDISHSSSASIYSVLALCTVPQKAEEKTGVKLGI